MNEDQQSSHATNGPVVFVAILTPFLTTIIFGLVLALAAYIFGDDNNVKGGRSGSFMLGLMMSFLVALAVCGGTVLSSPFLVFARIAKTWHSAILALAATVISYISFLTGVTGGFSYLFNFHLNVVDLYEPIAAGILIQFALISVLCLCYRGYHAPNVA